MKAGTVKILFNSRFMYIQTVALKDVRCFALHGYYSEEQLTGTEFLISAEVTFEHTGDTEELSSTVNYEMLNTIIQEEMANTQRLLETVVKRMLDRIIELYPFVKTAEASVKKMHPPMQGEINHSFVSLKYMTPLKISGTD